MRPKLPGGRIHRISALLAEMNNALSLIRKKRPTLLRKELPYEGAAGMRSKDDRVSRVLFKAIPSSYLSHQSHIGGQSPFIYSTSLPF